MSYIPFSSCGFYVSDFWLFKTGYSELIDWLLTGSVSSIDHLSISLWVFNFKFPDICNTFCQHFISLTRTVLCNLLTYPLKASDQHIRLEPKNLHFVCVPSRFIVIASDVLNQQLGVRNDIDFYSLKYRYIDIFRNYKINIDITIKILLYRVWSIFRLTPLKNCLFVCFVLGC